MSTTPTISCVSSPPDVNPVEASAEQPDSNLAPRKEDRDPAELKVARRRRLVIAITLMLVLIALVAGFASFSGETRTLEGELVLFTVQPGDLEITVTERGTLESQNNVQIICEVDDIHGDGILGTPILWIVENGSSVKKGDLIVELDSASHLERLDQQILQTDQARAKNTQAQLYYKNRITRNQTNKANAELEVQMAKLALQQYEDEQGGTFQIELQEIELGLQQREARLQIDQRNLTGTERLYELGYKSKGDLAQANLQALRAEGALKRETARRRELMEYGYTRSKLKLEGALQSAERARIQVGRDNTALLAQAEARKNAAEMSLKREEERLARYQEQLEKCKLYAPQDGMVAYHVEANRWGQSSTIAEGVAVRDRQTILSIPSLKRMQVKTSVHESVVDRIKTGMSATIRLDAFPNRHYNGTVDAVAVLPDPGGWLSSGTKVYKTIVKIDEDVDSLKPGMTAVAEVHIAHLYDILCVPVQAIVQRGTETWCYVVNDGQLEKCFVQTGKTNDKMVEIRSGLEAGDQVVLNPTAIVGDDSQREREVAPDKKKPAAI